MTIDQKDPSPQPSPPSTGARENHSWRNAAIAAGLFILTLLLYARVARFGFIAFDDPGYVYNNPHVKSGLNGSSIWWALTTNAESNWHPLTWLSHLLDVQLFGLRPGPMHVVNVLLHCINTVLVFWLLVQMTARRWASAWVAAMFAWHPLHVESVAWIAERKDVLSTMFLLLCLLAYVGYVRRRGSGRYVLVLVLLALGLMAKPMLVTTPCLILLLDVWPLKRWPGERASALLKEKNPLFAMILISSIITIIAQSQSVLPIHAILPEDRVANSIVSYVRYLEQMIWPARLAIFYPHPASLPGGGPGPMIVIGCALLLALITFLAVANARRAPWLPIGWLWYLGALVPTIGLVQVGLQATADRYSYIPILGIFIMIAWTADSLRLRGLIAGGAVCSLVAVAVVTYRQIGFWHDRESVMRHAIDVVPNNYLAHFNLGDTYDEQGDPDAAEREYQIALAIKPDDADSMNNLALLANAKGQRDQAIKYFEQAIATDPGYASAYSNFGNLLKNSGQTDRAMEMYQKALKLKPSIWQASHNLALLLAQNGKIDQAIPLWRQAIAVNADFADAHYRLGQALLVTGKTAEALKEMRNAVRLAPDRPDVLDTLAWLLATNPSPEVQNGPQAVELAQRACKLAGDEPRFLDTLAAAQARAGRFMEAQQTAQSAIDLAKSQNKLELANRIQTRIELYREQKPFSSEGN